MHPEELLLSLFCRKLLLLQESWELILMTVMIAIMLVVDGGDGIGDGVGDGSAHDVLQKLKDCTQ